MKLDLSNYTTPLIIILILMLGVILLLSLELVKKSDQTSIFLKYYESKYLVEVSPYILVNRISNQDDSFILVDLRSELEYSKGHIVGAINIPVVGMDNQTIVGKFRELMKQNPNKEIIVYCGSASCRLGDRIGYLLSINGINVKKLAVGWNEWKYYPKLFMGDADIDMKAFIVEGPEPGKYTGSPQTACVGESC
ncbi:MAG: rhodanese-like domain-containing protein [Candidatus Anstonellales archaeon]